mmetsp:Transcript_3816/g.8588  ORF Transcript_3816/g.8588 Transcript_3816/m.8588 type:complete len:358 (+) Transcript_3816:237-1310(+)
MDSKGERPQPRRQKVGVQENLSDRRPLFGIDVEALVDQVPHVGVGNGLQALHPAGFGVQQLLRGRQEPGDGVLRFSPKVVAPGAELVKDHSDRPGVVVLEALKVVPAVGLFGGGEFRRAGLGGVVLRGRPDGHRRFQVDALDGGVVAAAAVLLQHKIFRLEVRPHQSAGVHGLDALADADGRPAEGAVSETAAGFGTDRAQVFVPRFQHQRRGSFGDALCVRGGVDHGVLQERHLLDVARAAALQGKGDPTLGKHPVVVLALGPEAFPVARQLDRQPVAPRFGKVDALARFCVGLVGVVDLAALGGGPDLGSDQQVPGVSLAADDLAVQVVVEIVVVGVGVAAAARRRRCRLRCHCC